jgi:mannan endo-1,4-beta-mannosidase
MRTRITIVGATLVVLIASLLVSVQSAHAATGLRISGGRLVEANGTPFIMRGVSHAHTWYPSQTSSFANIKSLGANAVRVVLATGARWAKNETNDVANVVSLCKQNRLICVLEAHDTTGFGEQGGAITLSQAADYWISVRGALVGQENYIIVNIGNEPYGNGTVSGWAADTSNAISKLRNAGFEHTIMVDAPNWGQDWTFTMRDNAATVFNSDPARNTIFSIHMYGVFDTAAEVSDYLARFASAGLPLVVGEFGINHTDGNPDEDAIMSNAQSRGIGYLGWSWSGNSSDVAYLDMVNGFNVSSLTPWGQRIFNGANGIRQTAREATIFGSTQPSTPSSASPSSSSPSASPSSGGGTRSCTAAYSIVGQWAGGFQGEVRVTAGGAAITGWTVTWTFGNGQTISSSWSAAVTPNGASITARNMSYNGSLGAGAGAAFGFIGSWNGTNSVPSTSCTAT